MAAPAISRLPVQNSGLNYLIFPSNLGSNDQPYMSIDFLTTNNLLDNIGNQVSGAITNALTGQYGQLGGLLQGLFNGVSFSTSNKSVNLYIPEFTDKITPKWKDYSAINQEGIRSLVQTAPGIISDFQNGNKIDYGKLGANLSPAIAALLNNISQGGLIGQIMDGISFSTRTVINDKRTMLFEGVELREYQFSWNLTPKNAGEMNTIKNIVKGLKLQASPSKAFGSASFLRFPDPVNITFQNVDQDFYPPIRNAIIENVVASSGMNGYQEIFTDGTPVEVKLSLTVKELDILIKDGENLVYSELYK